MNRSCFLLLAILALTPCLVPEASARNPVVTKLHPRPGDVTREGYSFGRSVAVNENWVVVGADDFGPSNSLNPGDGSVYVFSARTGRLIRKIQPSRDLFGDLNGNAFGGSLALCGNRLLVGAPFFTANPDFSAALLYDLPSGRLQKVIRLEDP
ncbi:MAG: FG-GAP repeat protein, partial [Verrucomicrobiae bacterium]|nr:FG-GAP repeat protein [Verrucomicrobiae bacterium]